jgi:hypothetical protein
MKNTLHPASLALALSLLAAPTQAALSIIYSTDFNSPTYSDGGLIGQDGWAITGTSTVSPISVANTATNGDVTLVTTGQDVNRTFTPATTAGSIYLKSTITVSTAQVTGDYFLHLGDGGTSNFYARLYVRSSGTGYAMALGTSSGTAVNYGADLAFGATQTVLIRYDFVPGAANDTGAVFLNPTTEDGSADVPYILATTTGTDSASISSVNLRQGTAANAPGVTIDNIVVSIPETSSTAMLGLLAGVGMIRRRR